MSCFSLQKRIDNYKSKFPQLQKYVINKSNGGLLVDYDIVDIAEAGGNVRMLVGMAFYEGLKGSQEDALNELNQKLTYLTFQKKP